MIDLKQIALHFVESEYSLPTNRFAEDDEFDCDVLRVIADASMDPSIRGASVVRWLRRYSVIRTLSSLEAQRLAENLLTFADNRVNVRLSTSDQIKKGFISLEAALRTNLPLYTTKGKLRKIDSLTSKALWCCYPFDVPMLDAYAENSLSVISRLYGFSVDSRDRYERFVDAWFQFYGHVGPAVEGKVLDYAYNVRVVDRFLWWLGQGSFQETQVKT